MPDKKIFIKVFVDGDEKTTIDLPWAEDNTPGQ